MSWLNWLASRKDSEELKKLTEHVKSAKTLVELTWNVGKAVVQAGYEKHQADLACAEYLHRYERRHGQVKILGMSEPVELESIYTEVRIIDPDILHGYRTEEELHELYLQNGRSLSSYDFDNDEPRSGLEVANDARLSCLNVLGAPGAGKSTFLRYLGLLALQSYRHSTTGQLLRDTATIRYRFNLLPVLLELRGLRNTGGDFIALIDEELHTNGFPLNFGRAAMRAGGLLVLLDGLDEIPSGKLNEVIESIRDLVDRHPDCRFVTSCRTAFYKDYFTNFSDVLLADFTDDQIQNLIHNWFRSDRDRELGSAKTLWELLQDPQHQATRELARTPLLATFLCLVYDDRQTLPTNRAELYGDALRILLERWAASKRVHGQPVFPGLSIKRELLMLEQTAGQAYERQQYFFSAQELAKAFETFLLGEAGGVNEVDGRKVVEEIELRQGLIVQRAHDKYSFSHLTLHEFLAACHYHKSGRDRQIIAETLTDERWREIHLLLAGLQEPDADQFLLAMVQDTSKLLTTRPLHALMAWAKTVVAVGMPPLQTAARRAVVASYSVSLTVGLSVARDRGGNLAFARELALASDLARDLAGEYDRALSDALTRVSHQPRDVKLARAFGVLFKNHEVIPANLSQRFDVVCDRLDQNAPHQDQPVEKWRSYLKSIHKQLQDALEIPAVARDLSDADLQQLVVYLKCTRRILDCRESAERVTQLGWNRVCERLFAPFE